MGVRNGSRFEDIMERMAIPLSKSARSAWIVGESTLGSAGTDPTGREDISGGCMSAFLLPESLESSGASSAYDTVVAGIGERGTCGIVKGWLEGTTTTGSVF